MLFRKPKLKQAAGRLRAEMGARIAEQGGIARFFDIFLGQILADLDATERLHQWNPDLATDNPDDASRINQLRWLAGLVERGEAGRFVPYAQRLATMGPGSDIPTPIFAMSQGVAACMRWKGLPLFKTAFDMALMPMLLAEVKPATVFEVGSGSGASALWIADLLRIHGNNAAVHSVDIRASAASDPQVTYYAGDCRQPEALFPTTVLTAAPHPWLVMEDAHTNVDGVLAHMDQFMARGDYLMVEDSNGKRDAILTLLKDRPERYAVDTFFTDFFGRNATVAMDSILRRMD